MPGSSSSPSVADAKKRITPFDKLPDNVIDNILTRLPIKDAVRTSILARKWRFKWSTMSRLKFDSGCLPPSNQGAGDQFNKLVKIVDAVLLLHTGQIQQFKLLTEFPSGPNINRWIIYLARNHIKHIALSFSTGAAYVVPSQLFSCKHLVCLELSHCVFNPPACFQGFASLSSLFLKQVSDPNGRLESLISKCPLLKGLSLDNFEGSSHLNICAPNLESFYYYGNSIDLNFEHTKCLTKASFGLLQPLKDSAKQNRKVCNLWKLFDCFENVKLLLLCQYSTQFHGGSSINKSFPSMKHQLTFLQVSVDFTQTEEVFSTICLLCSSPNLEILEIQAFSTADGTDKPVASSSESQNQMDFMLNCLKTVKLADIIGIKQELHFIQNILAISPSLRTLAVSTDSKNKVTEDSKIFMELMGFPKASTWAKLVWSDNLEL